MKLIKMLFTVALAVLPIAQTQAATDLNIKYSSNYLMPAYIQFKENGSQYSVKARINVPLYNIQFVSSGTQANRQFHLSEYKDVRNDKVYSRATVKNNRIEYGKVKDGLKTEEMALPTFDLFTMAFQLSYYEKLPVNFQITNGKKLYPMENVFVQKSERAIQYNKQDVTEITYKFKTGDKDIMVKKHLGEQFPRYISYNRDGDEYELEFSGFVE